MKCISGPLCFGTYLNKSLRQNKQETATAATGVMATAATATLQQQAKRDPVGQQLPSEITDNTIIDFWFSADHEKFWFASTPQFDQLVTDKFGKLLSVISLASISSTFDCTNETNKTIMSLIILYDQLTRHVYRGNKDEINRSSPFALHLASHLVNSDRDLTFPDKHRVFILLPFRHTFQIPLVEAALNRVQKYRETENSSYYDRFLKATINSLTDLITPTIVPETGIADPTISNDDIFKILDPTSCKNLVDLKEVPTVEPIYVAFHRTLSKIPNLKSVTLSLSGGVDSMVCSLVLSQLAKQMGFTVQAVMINYGNRDSSGTEVEFVRRWTGLIGVPLYVRHIKELRRNRDNDRDLRDRNMYEKLTRRIRFAMYKRFSADECSPVVLGHNLDDCEENVIANILQMRSMDNLRGMNEFGSEDGCCIVRPLLDCPKKDIYAFADKYLVPHLEDSTPEWSRRGRTRRQLFPAFNAFDPALIPGLIRMADEMKRVYQIYDEAVIGRFYETAVHDTYNGVAGVRIPFTDANKERSYGVLFWKDIVGMICVENGFHGCSNKAIGSMIDRLERKVYGRINLGKTLNVWYTGSMLFFYEV